MKFYLIWVDLLCSIYLNKWSEEGKLLLTPKSRIVKTELTFVNNLSGFLTDKTSWIIVGEAVSLLFKITLRAKKEESWK